MAQAQDMSTAEWELMRVIWTMHEAGSSDIIRAIQGKKIGLNQLSKLCYAFGKERSPNNA